MLAAMAEASPIPVCVRHSYVGDCELLMTYGIGHPIRRPWWFQHIRNGGHSIGWDLGYWNREEMMRVTIDADHPHRLIRPEASERFDASGIALREDANPDGPAIVIGLTRKALRAHNMTTLGWEQEAVNRVRAMGKVAKLRLKRPTDPRLYGVEQATGEIEDVLRTASLVVCRHSNVAVDACIAGVPVICEDGASLALYEKNSTPSRDERLGFLRSLAHWQYKPSEAKDAWTFLLSRL